MSRVLFEDDWFLAVDKPSRMLSVPGRKGYPDLTQWVEKHHGTALVIHRLDYDTSGLILFARDPESQKRFSELFSGRMVEKTYIALCNGVPASQSGTIDLPLICDWPRRPRQKVDHEIGKPARTRWSLIESDQRTSRIELYPETGRSHQLRVHLAEMKLPIIGDPLYAPAHPGPMKLHATRLRFIHPFTDTPMVLISPPSF